ncbi:MAG TPA: hypothetical protein VJO12_11085 [Stellaceae bacterium]|nr:hypothetical protein [Stellaceae bacterium]
MDFPALGRWLGLEECEMRRAEDPSSEVTDADATPGVAAMACFDVGER